MFDVEARLNTRNNAVTGTEWALPFGADNDATRSSRACGTSNCRPLFVDVSAREKTVRADSTRVAKRRIGGSWKSEALQDHTRGFASGIIC